MTLRAPGRTCVVHGQAAGEQLPHAQDLGQAPVVGVQPCQCAVEEVEGGAGLGAR